MTLEQIGAVGAIVAFGAFVLWGRTAGRAALARASGEPASLAATAGRRRSTGASGRRSPSSRRARSNRGGR